MPTFLESLPPHGDARNGRILGAIVTGHLDPPVWVPVQCGPVELEVTADWLTIDGSRVPMAAPIAQAAAAALEALLPTPRIVEAIEAAARARGRIVPFVAWGRYATQLDTETILWRERAVAAELAGVPAGTLIAGAYKDTVLASYMPAGRVVIFGGLDIDGRRVQPVYPVKDGLTPGHGLFYDQGYAGRIRVVRDVCVFHGRADRISRILASPDAHVLGGPVAALRYPLAHGASTTQGAGTHASAQPGGSHEITAHPASSATSPTPRAPLTPDASAPAARPVLAAPSSTSTWTVPTPDEPLRRGHAGPRVTELQRQLGAAGFRTDVDGYFGDGTERQVRAFQRAAGLGVDGQAGDRTFRALREKTSSAVDKDPYADDAPAGPRALPPPLTEQECREVFGSFDWQPVGTDGAIRILGSWEKDNIRLIEVPQLRNVPPYAGPRGLVRCHRLLVDPVRELFDVVERRGEIGSLVTYDGAHVPRLVRGGTSLSNHSWGCAIDLNARWNPMGAAAVPRGKHGSVIAIVEIAAELGWGSGGVWGTPDWMHLGWRGGRPWRG